MGRQLVDVGIPSLLRQEALALRDGRTMKARWDDHLADSIMLFVTAYLVSPWSINLTMVLCILGVVFLGVPIECLVGKLTRKYKS